MTEGDPTQPAEKPVEKKVEVGKPARLSNLVPKKFLEAYVAKNRIEPEREYRVVAIVSDEPGGREEAILEPIENILQPGQSLPQFTPAMLREYFMGKRGYDHLRTVPVEYLQRGTEH